jgi:hypothetical protein
MQASNTDLQLNTLVEASRQLGNLSVWTLRKHLLRGNIRPTRLGRKVFVSNEEITRIQREGLPSLK